MPTNIIFNIAFGLVCFIYWLIVFVILYHLLRFGVGTQPKKFAFLFFLVSIALFVASLYFYQQIDTPNVLKL